MCAVARRRVVHSREKKIVVCNDVAAEPDVGCSKRREAIRRGYRSSIALPLLAEDAVVATLTLYAKPTDFFTQEEVGVVE